MASSRVVQDLFRNYPKLENKIREIRSTTKSGDQGKSAEKRYWQMSEFIQPIICMYAPNASFPYYCRYPESHTTSSSAKKTVLKHPKACPQACSLSATGLWYSLTNVVCVKIGLGDTRLLPYRTMLL